MAPKSFRVVPNLSGDFHRRAADSGTPQLSPPPPPRTHGSLHSNEARVSAYVNGKALNRDQLTCLHSIRDYRHIPQLLLPHFVARENAKDAEKKAKCAYTPLKSWQTRILVLHPETNPGSSGQSARKSLGAINKSSGRAIALEDWSKSYPHGYSFPHESALRFRKEEVISEVKFMSAATAIAVHELSATVRTISEEESLDETWCYGLNEAGEKGYFLMNCVVFEERITLPIKCELILVDVIDGPGLGLAATGTTIAYEALSYAWGDPTPNCLITINGEAFLIARELANALLYLRDGGGGKKRYLWCDGICINQLDLQEKAQQVKNMLRIFEKAENVVAWLGLPSHISGQFFYACRRLEQRDQILDEAIEPLIKQALDDVLSRRWFFRTWVRQEVFAAKRMSVQIGHYNHDFGSFADLVKRLDFVQTSRLPSIPKRQRSMPPTFSVYKREYQHSGTDRYDFQVQGKLRSFTKHWLSVLRSGALFDVSDERDRVYGALGLLTSPSIRFFTALPTHLEQLSKFPVYYDTSVSFVFQDVIKFLMQMTRSLEVLDAFTDRTYLENNEVPSWATDWGRKKDSFVLSWSGSKLLTSTGNMDDIWRQKDMPVGYLKVKGMRIASRMLSLHSEHKIEHHSTPSWTTFGDFIQSYYDDSRRADADGYRAKWGSYEWRFIFPAQFDGTWTYTKEVDPNDIPIQFTQYLAGRHYVTATFPNALATHSIPYDETKHYLVPRNACLDDIVVALYGSSAYHLLRPLADRAGCYRYLGPVVGLRIIPPPRDASDIMASTQSRQGIVPQSYLVDEQFMLL
ncbi:hypothetical protein GLAREA_04724 [Glarea lozoyensis ATCC 20868]|uniref:Heterokaryon incompatibility domain-containing protein n=1 Tax=Glarea lozoyensis (strain ATCC 20868 / MF5171) TaxID=1116229 RepID=S3DN71_GLAL2|nr:uncharacterized protein GLAREA_04724 [Glarea lozoyensis ATCC 20868]EPE27933.1 hypothetical protein GLAREA_04724 [Glarea lozoyensis ATCC 20868]